MSPSTDTRPVQWSSTRVLAAHPIRRVSCRRIVELSLSPTRSTADTLRSACLPQLGMSLACPPHRILRHRYCCSLFRALQPIRTHARPSGYPKHDYNFMPSILPEKRSCPPRAHTRLRPEPVLSTASQSKASDFLSTDRPVL